VETHEIHDEETHHTSVLIEGSNCRKWMLAQFAPFEESILTLEDASLPVLAAQCARPSPSGLMLC
jgi:hypothetical protein